MVVKQRLVLYFLYRKHPHNTGMTKKRGHFHDCISSTLIWPNKTLGAFLVVALSFWNYQESKNNERSSFWDYFSCWVFGFHGIYWHFNKSVYAHLQYCISKLYNFVWYGPPAGHQAIDFHLRCFRFCCFS